MRDSLGSLIYTKGGLLGNGDVILAKVVGFLKILRMIKIKGLYECGGRGFKNCDFLGEWKKWCIDIIRWLLDTSQEAKMI